MSVIKEIVEAGNLYFESTNEDPCFVVLPVNRARLLIDELIDAQGAFTPVQFIEMQRIKNDAEFAKRMTGTLFLGAKIIVLMDQMMDQMILGGWANDQPGVTGYDGGS